MKRDDYTYLEYTEEGYISANCNFCILTEDIENYNGYYAAFGKVTEGMDVIEAIAATRVEETTDENDNSTSEESDDTTNKITIKSIAVETYGVDYGNPETVNYETTLEKVNQIYSQYFGGNTSAINVE